MSEEKTWPNRTSEPPPEPPENAAVRDRVEAAKRVLSHDENETSMPEPLLKTILIDLALAFGMLALGVVLTIQTKKISYAVPLIFSAFLAYLALSMLSDYRAGKIHERVLLCTSANSSFPGFSVTMQTTDKEGPVDVFKFYYRNRKSCPFKEGYVYAVYTNDNQPHRVIAWKNF